MDYQQIQEQQKEKAVEQARESISLAETAVSESPSPRIAGGTGNFLADLTASLDAYESGKGEMDAINAELAGMKDIKIPQYAQKTGLSKFFWNLFHGKEAKQQAAAVEEAEQKKAEQDKRRAELESQKGAASSSMGDALSQFSSLMGAATKSNIKEMINNEAVVRRIMASLPEDKVKSTLDLIYPEMDEAHMDLFMDMITARFSVPIVDSSQERIDRLSESTKKFVLHDICIQKADGTIINTKAQPLDWTFSALQKIYAAYLTIPAEHLKLVRCLVHYADNENGGAALGEVGVYWVNYVKGREEQREGDPYTGSCTSSTSDTRNGMNKFTLTLIHELGHVVDGKHDNYGYSDSPEFRKWSEWVEVPKNDPTKIVNYMIESMENIPYNNTLSEKELNLAIDISKAMIKKQEEVINSWSKGQSFVKTKVNAKEDLSDTEKEALIETFSSRDKNNLIYHIWMGLGAHTSSSCLGCYNHSNVMQGMKRPFYQGYDYDPWFSFNNARWSNKISAYQYRCPKEEFAETYASYHAAPTATREVNGQQVPYKKGDKTPEGLKTWFEKEGLHQMTPDKVEGTSEIKNEKMAS